MKITFFLAIVPLFLLSCKKEKKSAPVNNPASSYTLPSTAGSYWVYHWSNIDSSGNETPSGQIDTVWLTGSQTIGGKTYLEYYGTQMGGIPQTWLERDSSGYIVGVGGNILYAYIETDEIFSTHTDEFYDQTGKMGPHTTLVHSLGTFNVIDAQNSITRAENSQLPYAAGVNACGDESYTMHTYYTSGIGKLRMETAYISQFMNCGISRGNLVDYYIAP